MRPEWTHGMAWKNFRIWRGRLPHWRADEVTYYATFRHSRPLDASERFLVFNELLRHHAREFQILVLCVLAERTEMVFTVEVGPSGGPYELADVIEKSKAKAGRKIVKRTRERFPPFYHESFDRIVRDDVELEARFAEIIESPVQAELCEDPEDYECLWVQGHS